jgi:hypothetical protein
MRIWAAMRVPVDLSWRRALVLATDNRERAPWQGARYKSSNSVSFECPLGARREATQDGGTRFGGGGPHDRPLLEKPGMEGFLIHMLKPHIFCGVATR